MIKSLSVEIVEAQEKIEQLKKKKEMQDKLTPLILELKSKLCPEEYSTAMEIFNKQIH